MGIPGTLQKRIGPSGKRGQVSRKALLQRGIRGRVPLKAAEVFLTNMAVQKKRMKITGTTAGKTDIFRKKAIRKPERLKSRYRKKQKRKIFRKLLSVLRLRICRNLLLVRLLSLRLRSFLARRETEIPRKAEMRGTLLERTWRPPISCT